MMLYADAVVSRSYDRRAAARPAGPGLPDKLAARLHSHALDRALIDGARANSSPQLAAHAARITARSTRFELADFLDRFARSGHERRAPSRVRPHRAAVTANATELHALAAVLRGCSRVHVRGVAMLRELVSDGTGPAYTDRDGRALDRALGLARAALTGEEPAMIRASSTDYA